MKQIINGKLYDTDSAEYVITAKREQQYELIEYDIYKTKNNRYFAYNKVWQEIIDESKLKQSLGKFFVDLYIELFGEVEEG